MDHRAGHCGDAVESHRRGSIEIAETNEFDTIELLELKVIIISIVEHGGICLLSCLNVLKGCIEIGDSLIQTLGSHCPN